MTSQQSSGDLISNRYASALYELASESKVIDSILEDLNFIQSILSSNKELQSLITSPLIASNDKLQVLLKIISNQKTNSLSKTFLKVISQNKRFAKLSTIIMQFININSQKRGEILADVTSADSLSEDQKENIQILGEVKIPGSYPILKDNESLQSFINRAGGFTEKSFEGGIEIYRDTLRLAWNKMSISLMPKDSVVIKERPGTIFVTGEVYNPGLVEFDPQKSLKNYFSFHPPKINILLPATKLAECPNLELGDPLPSGP